MDINRDLIEYRIGEINDTIRLLEKLLAKNFIDLNIYEKFSIRYLVIQLVEASSSICMHILINVFNEVVKGYPECFIKLGEKNILPKFLSDKLASAARLRNLLVHRYWVIDDEKVYDCLRKGLDDFKSFIKYVKEFLGEKCV